MQRHHHRGAPLVGFWAGAAVAAAALAACTPPAGMMGTAGSDGGAGADMAVDNAPVVANPFVGSGGFGFAFGSSFPGALSPNGLCKVGPDTSGKFGTSVFLHYSGYWYDDDTIRSFSHVHLHGTGATDYGVLGVMPTDGLDASRTAEDGASSKFAKASESASPGYYTATLDRGNIKVELTATQHAAQHRYTYPSGATEGYVLVDLDHHLEGGTITAADFTLDPANRKIRGHLHSRGGMSGGFGGYDIYFEMRTKQAWKAQKIWTAHGAPTDGTTASGAGIGYALVFDLSDPQNQVAGKGEIDVEVGISMVAQDHAAANLEAEITSWNFDDTRQKTQAAWDEIFGRVTIAGGTPEERRTFLSAIYHAFEMPSVIADVDGSYIGPDKQMHVAADYHHVSDISGWDVYRTLHPLYDLIAQDRALDVVRSFVDYNKQGGYFPKWPIALGESGSMIGSAADVMISDSYVKGVTKFDAMDAYARLRGAAMDAVAPAGGRGGRGDVEHYMMYGYVPDSDGSGVSKTTEYAVDDFALANFAGALGKSDDAAVLQKRAESYRNLYDPATSFLWSKDERGRWTSKHDDAVTWITDFREANAWQSLWMCNYDIDGMVALLGGKDAFLAKLSSFFDQAKAEWESIGPTDVGRFATPRPYYWAGNEPDIQTPYMFAQSGRPDLAQKWVKWAMATQFSSQPKGLPGNDDGGTMSAWYAFSAIGFYPIAGSDRYIVGTPSFTHVEIKVPGGVFTVSAPDASTEKIYVQSAKLNGAALAKPEFRHGDLKAGGSLEFVMGAAPSSWGQ